MSAAGTPMADGQPAGPDGAPAESPLEIAVRTLVDRLETLAKDPEAKLTCDDLIATIGTKSHALAILIFSLLNLLPAPPGFNAMVGLLVFALSGLMMLDRPVHLWAFIGHRRLPLKLLIKLLGILRWLTQRVARFSRPRWLALTGRTAQPFIGVFNLLMGLTLLIPIPFTNMLPSAALAMVALALLNRDGLILLLALVTGIVGMLVAFTFAWLLIVLVLFVEHEIEEVIEDMGKT